jgi:two-component system response regulator MtrA
MTPKILVVDDDNALREMVGIVLTAAGFDPTYCPDGNQALAIFEAEQPDLVLLDVMLPGKSGIDVCRDIRTVSGTPIIMLTAKSETNDVVLGLEAGADDYMVKPFEPSELTARIKARLRPITSSEARVSIGPLVLDVEGHQVLRDGQPVSLTPGWSMSMFSDLDPRSNRTQITQQLSKLFEALAIGLDRLDV